MNKVASATDGTYLGTRAITLKAGTYSATILPEIGGNVVAFEETTQGLSFLRTPKTLGEILEKPTQYGIPLLFPPNRIEDGTFTVNGRTYHFPINEVERNNHIHGFLLNEQWEVVDIGADSDSERGENDATGNRAADEAPNAVADAPNGAVNAIPGTNQVAASGAAYVTLRLRVDEHHRMYSYFPHEFSISRRYTLWSDGLTHEVRVVNKGRDAMPFMLGFHTTLNVPFAQESSPDDYAIQMTIGDRLEMSERMLPTGRTQPLRSEELALRDTGVNPFVGAMDNHYTASPLCGRNFVKLMDRRMGAELVYDVGLSYKHWMLFNNFGRTGFICPEPQTCIVNAPNSDLSAGDSGLLLLEPGQEWVETSRMYVNLRAAD